MLFCKKQKNFSFPKTITFNSFFLQKMRGILIVDRLNWIKNQN